MANPTAQLQSTNILTRFKVFEEKHHLNRKVYRNRGVLKDAERFSLIDPVLDGEYNDFDVHEYRKKARETRRHALRRQLRKHLNKAWSGISGSLFRVILVSRMLVYFLFHLGYKAE